MSALNRRRLRTGSLVLVLLTAGILAAVNVIAQHWFFRIDLTEDRRYSIAPATKNVLAGIDDVVNVDAWFSRDLPPYLTGLKRQVRDVLDEYRAYSGGKVNVEFKDPGDDPLVQQKLRSLGIPEVQLEILEKDQFQLTTAYMGIALHYGGRTETLPLVQSTSRLEYELTSAILRLTVTEKKVIGWMGPTEDDHFRTAGNPLLEELRGFYDLQELEPEGLREIPEGMDTLILAGPRDLSEETRFAVDQFVVKGGRLICLVDHFTMPGGGLFTQPVESGVHDLLEHYGVRVEKNVVVEPFSNVQASFSSGLMQFRVPYPFWPRVVREQLNGEHPVTAGIETIVLPWTSSLEVLVDEGGPVSAEVLASSSSRSWTESGQYNFSPQRRVDPPASGEALRSRPLAVLLSGSFKSFWEGREPPAPPEGGEAPGVALAGPATSILVVGTSQPLRQEFLQQFPSNGVLLLNAVDWMTFGSELIGIRSRISGERTLPQLSEKVKTIVKVGNIVVFPALLGLFGLSYLFLRRRGKDAR